MFSLFIVLLSFSSSLTRNQTKCLFLSDEPCMVRLTPIDLNPVELNMITNKNEAKALTENVWCDCKCKFNSAVIQIKNGIIKHVNVNVKVIKKDDNRNPSAYICENSKYLKSTSVTECDEIISVMDIVSTKNTNVTSNVSINCHRIKVRDCYNLQTVLLAIILLLIIIIFCYHYVKQTGVI